MANLNLPPNLPPFKPLPPSINMIPFVFGDEWTVLEKLSHLKAYVMWLIECVKQIQEWAANIDTDLEGIHNTINQIINNLTEIDNRITNLENNNTDWDGRIKDLEEDIVKINDEINIINANITNISEDITTINNSINNINATINHLKVDITDLVNRVESIEEEQNTQNENINNNSQEIEKLKKSLNDLIGNGEGSINDKIAEALLDYVKKSGDTMTGDLIIDDSTLNLKDTDLFISSLSGLFGYLLRELPEIGLEVTQHTIDSNGEKTESPIIAFKRGAIIPAKSIFSTAVDEVNIGDSVNTPFNELFIRKINFSDGTTMSTAPTSNDENYLEKTGGAMTGDLIHDNSTASVYKLGANSNSYLFRRFNGVGFCIAFKENDTSEPLWLIQTSYNKDLKMIYVQPNDSDGMKTTIGSQSRIIEKMYLNELTFSDGSTMTTAGGGDYQTGTSRDQYNSLVTAYWHVSNEILFLDAIQLDNVDFNFVFSSNNIMLPNLQFSKVASVRSVICDSSINQAQKEFSIILFPNDNTKCTLYFNSIDGSEINMKNFIPNNQTILKV